MPIYICQEGKSNKMWGYTRLTPRSVKVEWGRIGLAPESQVKEFTIPHECDSFIEKKVAEKLNKKYKLKTEDELTSEAAVARAIGTQHKINRIEWVAKDGSKLNILDSYDASKGVFVEILNSWSKESTYLYIDKQHSAAVQYKGQDGDVINIGYREHPADASFVSGVKMMLSKMSVVISKVYTNAFAAVGRVLDIDGEIHKVIDVNSVSAQVVAKFVKMSGRVLDI